ncbi:hypothetical protein N7468_007060 [Penicillium chermesinum]|uniref:K Homology domain-containing protein n=1 Tax=Penicillium chermesinum TaxID=63820 RepID=A0A9W9NTL1_9EURO|nr:uncharacterized protein N7468_007060 [Penicillium chermesinum]KAJ5225835.1 hypothetical protein N7468_007060 [Penicillium chermesinum]
MSDSPTNLTPPPPSAPSELPDAKRLALGTEKTRTEVKAETDASTNEPTADSKDTQGDTIVSDAANDNVQAEAQPQPIQSTASQAERAGSSSEQPNQQDETHWIHIRAVISSQEAATVIGKAGENVSQIRRMSGAKCTVSDYSRGAFERILTVSGLQDAVAKAFALIIRTLNNEPLDAASTAQSKTYPLRLLIPHILIGSIIGKGGSRIREIQEASGARLNASDACLPLSTERSLVIVGVADAVHIATYYVAVTLVEQLTDRFGGPAASAYATRSGGPAGAVPGGMQVVPYVPQPAGGQYGHPDQFKRHHPQQSRAASGAYGVPYMHGQPTPAPVPQAPMPYAAAPHTPYPAATPHQPAPYVGPQPTPARGAPTATPAPAGGNMPGQPLTQQIYIPNDMVGAIIGKGGAKINEIRHLSGSVIKINEPQENSNERLVTITGTPECNQMALYMLYTRLGESESVNHNRLREVFLTHIGFIPTESEKHRV